MKHLKLLTIAVAIILYNGSQALSETKDESALHFLTDVLSDEFLGSDGAWAGRAIYSNPDRRFVGDYNCVTPREIFSVIGEPIEIIKEWRIGSSRSEGPSDIVISVQFYLLARTTGIGIPTPTDKRGWDIIPLASNTWTTEAYRLRKSEGMWKLVDPAVPHVGIEAVKSQLAEQLSNATRFKNNISNYKDPRQIAQINTQWNWAERESKLLDQIHY
jgi:hypothetical protein